VDPSILTNPIVCGMPTAMHTPANWTMVMALATASMLPASNADNVSTEPLRNDISLKSKLILALLIQKKCIFYIFGYIIKIK
jgi:hypothetical protein